MYRYTNNDDVRSELKHLIENSNHSIAEVARMMGISKQALSKTLNNYQEKLDFNYVSRILNCLDYELEYYFNVKTK